MLKTIIGVYLICGGAGLILLMFAIFAIYLEENVSMKYRTLTAILMIIVAIMTFALGYQVSCKEYKEELTVCKGMNRTYLEEYQNLKERCNEIEQYNMELRFDLDSCNN